MFWDVLHISNGNISWKELQPRNRLALNSVGRKASEVLNLFKIKINFQPLWAQSWSVWGLYFKCLLWQLEIFVWHKAMPHTAWLGNQCVCCSPCSQCILPAGMITWVAHPCKWVASGRATKHCLGQVRLDVSCPWGAGAWSTRSSSPSAILADGWCFRAEACSQAPDEMHLSVLPQQHPGSLLAAPALSCGAAGGCGTQGQPLQSVCSRCCGKRQQARPVRHMRDRCINTKWITVMSKINRAACELRVALYGGMLFLAIPVLDFPDFHSCFFFFLNCRVFVSKMLWHYFRISFSEED